MIFLFSILFNLIALNYFVNSCGVTTHIEIAHRAFTHYDHLLDKQTSVFKVKFKFLYKNYLLINKYFYYIISLLKNINQHFKVLFE